VWDAPANYPTSTTFHTITSDGTSLFMATRPTTLSTGTTFYTLNQTTPGSAVSLGANPGIYYVTGFAADASFFYVVGRDAAAVHGLYRIDRANLAAPAVRLAAVAHDTLSTNVVVDDLTAANHIYVRDANSAFHVVASVGTTPIYLGSLMTIGTASDVAMSIDRTTNTVYVFNTSLATNGGISAIQ
jgi:hypothetical protein